jgi:transcriptional regulator with XRE-family HTH domain
MIGPNIRYLRKKNRLSQQELAEQLSIPRSTLSDYEREHTQVNMDNLLKLSDIFNITIDNLIKTNLSHTELEIVRNPDFKVLAISVDSENNNNIELVETKASAGYLSSFTDPEYIRDLPKISFPNIQQGTYRAFEIQGDSMLPLDPGSIVICSYIENLKDIKSERTYVIISKTEGVVYKRVRPDFQKKRLLLISDNEAYLPYYLDFEDIEEIWQHYCHLSFSDSRYTFNAVLEERLSDIQKRLSEVQQAILLAR